MKHHEIYFNASENHSKEVSEEWAESQKTNNMKESKEEPNQVGEKARTKEDILYDHFKRVCTPSNNRAPLETQLTLVTQAALLAMEEYLSEYSQAYQLRQSELVNELYARITELESKLTPIEPLKEETKLQSEQKTAEDGFKEKLAIEILARFTGSSRGTPIAKQGFIDGALWAASQFKPSVWHLVLFG